MTNANLSRLACEFAPALENRPALIADDRTLRYGELATAVEKLAGGLADALGIRAGDRIAIILPNRIEFAIGYLATLRIGAVVVPLNPTLAPKELADILTECEPRLLVLLADSRDAVSEALAAAPSIERLVLVDTASNSSLTSGPSTITFEALVGGGSPRAAAPTGEDDLAAILYTSGTTGRPKGILLSHRNMRANVESLARVRTWDDHETFLTVLPLFHGYAATAMMLLALRLGATNLLESRFVPPRILERIASYRVTFFAGVPPMYSVFLKMCDPADYDLSSCRVFLSGAAPLPVPLFEQFRDRFGIEIVEGYGPQECSPVVSVNPMLGRVKPGTVGPPIPDVEVAITDEAGNPCATGVDGEIRVRGDNVMLGYFENPDETARVLEDGWYRTGDMGRLDEDGFLSITGRIKEMIIVNGENVYPAEVEAVLYEHEAVADAAVKGMPDPVRGERIVAFVVPRPSSKADDGAIIAHCTRALAPFKVPHDIRFVDAIPRSAAGKILRLELPES